jgi:hypothetical protein
MKRSYTKPGPRCNWWITAAYCGLVFMILRLTH